MTKTRPSTSSERAAEPAADHAGAPALGRSGRRRIALLSNPKSTGNLNQLPRIRAFCADHPDIFHYEVEHAHQIGEAMKTIARVRPQVLVINGGDGTVQAALTELYNGDHFGEQRPPVAVLPSGKTNLIALDLGARGDPVAALEQLISLSAGDLKPVTVARELIALSRGPSDDRPVIGMFLGGAGLADAMLYCRDKIYPLGLPNSLAHVLTGLALVTKMLFGIKSPRLPPDPRPVAVSLRARGVPLSGTFSLLMVTTLEKLLLSGDVHGDRPGSLKLIAVDEKLSTLLRAFFASLLGKLGTSRVRGVHFEEADEITIEGEESRLILDGETFSAELGRPIHLRPARPLAFVKLAA